MSEQWPEAASSCSLDGFGNLNVAQELVCESEAARKLLRTFVEDYGWDTEHPMGGALREISSNAIPESLNHHLSEPLPVSYSQRICASYTLSGRLVAVRTPLGGNNAGQEIIDEKRYFVVIADLENPEAGVEHWETTSVVHRRSALDKDSYETTLLLRPHQMTDETYETQENKKNRDMATLRLTRQGIIFCPRRGDAAEMQLGPVHDLVLALAEQQRAIEAEHYVEPQKLVEAREAAKREQQARVRARAGGIGELVVLRSTEQEELPTAA